ncbi:multicopper oxidase family protein [Mangrovicoccus algicola]|uniref:Multicopper oxidase domain-containing protein n=1 Tax=Mangrovicoccus algicola TaxID=2771008 RepID=A0A8J6YQE3_9RHOB|nr:multicopper oxidase domain-containing protein [Mangrovicoccus algicola]MBE3637638.1 multicopper oxidase domain-containing protein [Mangrovicoccus algicola]
MPSRRRTLASMAALGLGLPALAAAPSPRPELPRPAEFDFSRPLTATRARLPFAGGQSGGYGYDGLCPGPLIRVRSGAEFRIRVANALREETTFHWHGLVAPTAADGQPQAPVLPGTEQEICFPIRQRAALSWYHPHPHGATARQAWNGLGGLFVINDAEEDALDLPAGDDELFLVLRDAQIGGPGRLLYPFDPDGTEGRVPLVNGVINPRTELPARQVRLRILNAANARVFRLSAGAPLTVIGNDGGLLPAPVPVNEVQIGPAERLDLILDLRGAPPGGSIGLRDADFEEPLVDIAIRAGAPDRWEIPARLSRIEPLVHDGTGPDRVFRFEGDSSINGQGFDPRRIDFAIPFGKVERWRFYSAQGAPHPIHVHGAHFQVIAREGGRGRVEPWETGWKDTVLKWAPEQVDVLIRFDAYEGRYLLHCHKLEHEDGGMMLNFVTGRDPQAALERARIEALYGPICTTP